MSAATSVPREQLVAFLGEMLLIRRFEERVTERFRAGDLAGFLHAAIGQEAVAVGVCRAFEDGDVIASTHRAHGHVLANATPANEVMAELYGKVEGCSHGYGGSMHLYDVERGNMGANAVVGGGLPATVGAALAFQMRREPRVAVAFFGDGATNIGTFHKSMNLVQLWRVPVVFVCENNRWSESTPQSRHQPVQNLTQRAAAYGMHASHVDGQDVEAVHLAALEALTHARAGDGPVFLLCETERLTGHYIGDPQVYRDKDEIRKLRESTARRRRVARVREGRHRPEPRRRAQERLRGAVRRPQATKLRRREEKPMERVAIVARLQEGSETRAAEIIAEGAPFDLAETGFVRHSVYLSASEVVFVFEGLQVDSPLTELVDDRPYPMGPALDQWRAIVDGPPRIARERFGWKRDEAEPLATDLAVGGGKWT